MLHRTARDAAPTYTALCEQVRAAPVVTPDETGWRGGAERHWLWVFATPETTVYAICPGRGFDAAATVLGADFDGVLVRDGWAPYRCFQDALHQTCLAHLLRRCRELRDDHPHDPWAAHVQDVLQAALGLRDRRAASSPPRSASSAARPPRRSPPRRPRHSSAVSRTASRRPTGPASPHDRAPRTPDPKVRARARLHRDDAPRLRRNEIQHLGSAQLLAEGHRPVGPGAVNLKAALRQIDADDGSVSHRMPCSGGGVHPIIQLVKPRERGSFPGRYGPFG